MTSTGLCKKVTIFEGVDGSGKSTAAQDYAKLTNARYVHFGPMVNVVKGFPRMFAEAMLPALLGYQDVVLDRCWLSDGPYGTVFRDGEDRIQPAGQRMLERLAMRCGAVVVYCDPGLDKIREIYAARKSNERLNGKDFNFSRVEQIYSLYAQQETALPKLSYNWQKFPSISYFNVDEIYSPTHVIEFATAGNWQAPICLVGENFADHKEQDSLYQWPFASFSKEGCSWWLTEQLYKEGISEKSLLWVNSDQDLTGLLIGYPSIAPKIISLGSVAAQALFKAGVDFTQAPHPQYWKRFRAHDRYQLLDLIKERIAS